jgi:methylase of polypeptide subunit release factors
LYLIHDPFAKLLSSFPLIVYNFEMPTQQEIIEKQRENLEEYKEVEMPYIKDAKGISIIVGSNVLPPKFDSILLAENMRINPGDTVLDTCAGSGVQAVFAAKKAKRVVSCDINIFAIENIVRNITFHKLEDKVEAIQCDLFPKTGEKYDVIAANLPYTDHKAQNEIEKMYWDEGNKTLIRLMKEAKAYLNEGGRIYLSWANFANYELIEELAQSQHFTYEVIADEPDPKKPTIRYRVYEFK